MQTIDLKNHIVQIFDSAEELIDHAKNVIQDENELVSRFIGKERTKFVGRRFDSWPAVYSAIRENWPEGQSALESMLDSLQEKPLPVPSCRKRKTRFSEENGDEIDFDRLRTGRDYWRSSYRENQVGPNTITLMIDVAGSCRKTPQELLWRGAAAIALATILENSGYRVELWAITASRELWKRPKHGWTDSTMAVCLKRPEDVLDPSTLINSISGWFFRSILFRAEVHPKWETNDCLGYHQEPTPKILDEISLDASRVLISEVWDERDAARLIAEKLVALTQAQPA